MFGAAEQVSAVAYNASDGLGQISADTMVFTASTSAAGATGMNGVWAADIDTVNHRLFVSDLNNSRVLVFELDTNNDLVDHTADWVLGQTNFSNNSDNMTQSGLGYPTTVLYDADNDYLFVADWYHSRVIVYDVESITNGENAIAVLGQANFTTWAGTTTQSTIYTSWGLALDRTSSPNRLFVSDQGSSRVLVFDIDVITDGEPAIAVLGQSDYSSFGVGNGAGEMDSPDDAAYDSVRNYLYVSDGNARILVFDVSSITNGEDAIYVLGQDGFGSSAQNADQNGMSSGGGLSYDATTQRLYAADAWNSRIMIWDLSSIENGEDVVGVIGQPDFDTAALATTQTTLRSSQGVLFDATNNRVYVSDTVNNRVVIYDLVDITTTSLVSGKRGDAYSQTLTTTNEQGTVSYALTSGTLPTGLSLGSLTGTPTQDGTFSFSIQATDDNGDIGSFVSQPQSYTLTVAGVSAVPLGPWLNTASSPPGPNTTLPGGLTEGDTISTPNSNDPDIYIVNEHGFKRLFLNPVIFNFYGHLGGFSQVTNITSQTRDSYTTSGLLRNCQSNDQQVYAVEATGEDTGILHHVNISGDDAISQDPSFFQKVFCINTNEFSWYAQGTPYTSLSQVPVYRRD